MADPHDHGHSHGHGHSCTHENLQFTADGVAVSEDPSGASLLPHIDSVRMRAYNEKAVGSARRVFKALADRLDRTLFVESDRDPELLIHVPFTSTVRLRSVCVAAPLDGRAPLTLRLFVNRDDIDLSNAWETTPAQELELPEDAGAEMWHPLRVGKFNNILSVTMAFRGTHGGAGTDELQINFIGLKGAHTGFRSGVVATVYESRGIVSDHEVPADEARGHALGY